METIGLHSFYSTDLKTLCVVGPLNLAGSPAEWMKRFGTYSCFSLIVQDIIILVSENIS